MSRSALSILGLFILTFHADAVVIQQNKSTAGISGYGAYTPTGQPRVTTPYSQSASAALNATFNANLSHTLPLPPGSGAGTGFSQSTASQNSSATATRFQASATTTSAGFMAVESLMLLDYTGFGQAQSTFDIFFQVLEPTPYHLRGFLQRPLLAAAQSSTLALSTIEGTKILEEDFVLNDASQHDFDLVGILPPGTYRLTANAQTESYGRRNESNTGFANFALTMDFLGSTTVGPSIISQPRSRTNVVGSSLIMSVSAQSDESLTYQWYKNGIALEGETGRTIVFTNVQTTSAGLYHVRASDSRGFILSTASQLTILPLSNPSILKGPVINSANGHHYYLLAQSTWVEAETQAQVLGGHLATLRNASEQDWVMTNFANWNGQPRNLWIGLHDADPSSNSTNRLDRMLEFVWSSGEPMSYTNWNVSEPNNYRELGEFYVHTLSPNQSVDPGTWNDSWDSDANGLPNCGVVECGVSVVYLKDDREINLVTASSANVFDEAHWQATGQRRQINSYDADSDHSSPNAPFADFDTSLSVESKAVAGHAQGTGTAVGSQGSKLRQSTLSGSLSVQANAQLCCELAPGDGGSGTSSTISKYGISFMLLEAHDYFISGNVSGNSSSLEGPGRLPVTSLAIQSANLGNLYAIAAENPPPGWMLSWQFSTSYAYTNVLRAGVYRIQASASAEAGVTSRYNPYSMANASLSLTCKMAPHSVSSNAITFNNYSHTAWSPIFGPDPDDPRLFRQGNTSNGLPPNVQRYGGVPLLGTNWTVELWGAEGADQPEANLLLQAKTTIQALTEAERSLWGLFLAGTVALDGIWSEQPATFQVRVYDGRGGTVAGWVSVLADPTVLRGWSRPLTVQAGLVRSLQGLESFNVHVPAHSATLPPVVYTQPPNFETSVGEDVIFNPIILGAQPVTYQWYFQNRPILDQNGETLSITGVNQANSGQYFLVASNAYGVTTSRIATLRVNGPVLITQQPVEQLVPLGGTATFTVSTIGYPAPAYQWWFNNGIVPGANLNSLIITNVGVTHSGGYAVVAQNQYGSITSSIAHLLISPSIQVPFLGTTAVWGRSASLSITAVGSGPLNYQWFRNGEAIATATNSTLTFAAVQISDAGPYSVVVSSVWGSVTNPPAPLVVDAAKLSLATFAGLTIDGVTGFTYRIQFTSDLADTNSWTTLTNLTLATPIETWVDLDSAGKPRRFYRVLSP